MIRYERGPSVSLAGRRRSRRIRWYPLTPLTLPYNTVPPSISGTVRVGSTLTANPGTWVSVGALTYTYQWLRCSTTSASCTPILGANANQYVVQSADVGSYIRVLVDAFNV